MNNGWIKSYRKAQFNEIWQDQTAWRIFQWIIWNVDYSTGKGTFGRKQISSGTGIPETTVYEATQRLTTKYGAISAKSNNRFTEFSVSHWARYQSLPDNPTQEPTANRQQNAMKPDTIKEVKNIRNKNNVGTGTSKNSLTPCTENELIELSKELEVSLEVVRKTHSIILNKIKANEFKNKTVYYTLSNWVLGDIQKGFVVKQKSVPKVHYREVLDKEGKVVSYETV